MIIRMELENQSLLRGSIKIGDSNDTIIMIWIIANTLSKVGLRESSANLDLPFGQLVSTLMPSPEALL